MRDLLNDKTSQAMRDEQNRARFFCSRLSSVIQAIQQFTGHITDIADSFA